MNETDITEERQERTFLGVVYIPQMEALVITFLFLHITIFNVFETGQWMIDAGRWFVDIGPVKLWAGWS